MSCDLTAGRAWKCKEQLGGIEAVYFANFGQLTGLTVTNGEITTGLSGKTLYKYELPEYTASLTENLTASAENGTIVFEQVLEMTLHQLSASDRNEIKLLATGRPHIIVVDNNGNKILLGFKKGMNVTAGTAVTGAAGADLSGYTLSFTGNEKDSFPFITDDLTNATIVTGS